MDRIDRVAPALDPGEIGGRLRFDPARAGFESLSMLVGSAREFLRPHGARDVAPCAEHRDLGHFDPFALLSAARMTGSLPGAS